MEGCKYRELTSEVHRHAPFSGSRTADADALTCQRTDPQTSVSVVIPVYNGEAFLERTVLTAASQTYPISKIIVVNDGSTDRTAAVLRKLSARISNLQIINTENRGVANARNLGTAAAESRYVAYLDADDLWHPTKVAKQVEALKRHGDNPEWAACYTYSRMIDSDDKIIGSGRHIKTRGSFFASHLLVNHVGNGSNLLVRRDVALAVGGFDASYAARGSGGCEDKDFQFRLLANHRVELVPEYLTGYRKHDKAMSRNIIAMSRGAVEVIEKYVEDPRVGRRLRQAALVSVYSYAWRKQFSAGHFSESMHGLISLFSVSPIYALQQVAIFVMAAGGRKARSVLGLRGDLGHPPPFHEVDPTWGVEESLSRGELRWQRKLVAFDREFYCDG